MTDKLHDEIAWVSDATGFGSAKPSDDHYHGKMGVAGSTLTETWCWGFQHPPTNTHCFIYIYMHPNVGSVTGGLWVHRGNKPHAMFCDFHDMHSNMSDDIFDADKNIMLANGMRVEFIAPMRQQRITYAHEGRGFSIDLTFTAFMDAAMRSNNKHFEQGSHVTGTCVLNGETMEIDCLYNRDRSWGELRPEMTLSVPPYTWMNGLFSKDFVFNIGCHDDPALDPEWKDHFHVPPEKIVKDAWIRRDGRMLKVPRVSKITTRDETLTPLRTVIHCTDEEGRDYEFVGEITAGVPWNPWHNCHCHIALARWTSPQFDGEGWGEHQEVQWNDYLRLCYRPG